MTIQDQYMSTVRQVRDTGTEVFESLTKDMKKAFGGAGTSFGVVDANAFVDQVFDFWEKTLEVQRDFAKKVVGVTTEVSETLRDQLASAGEAVRDQVEATKHTVHEQVEATKEAVHEQAAKAYDEMTKVELQDQLAARDLPKTGNVDELRERLVEDDQN